MQWYPPVYAINYSDSEYFTFTGFREYMFNFYYAVMIYGFGDIYPRNNIENIVCSIALITSLMVSNFYVSEIATLIHITS